MGEADSAQGLMLAAGRQGARQKRLVDARITVPPEEETEPTLVYSVSPFLLECDAGAQVWPEILRKPYACDLLPKLQSQSRTP